jgi:hypothetical protein
VASDLADESPNRLSAAFPILGRLPSYQRAWLGRDVTAGVIVVCLLIPERSEHEIESSSLPRDAGASGGPRSRPRGGLVAAAGPCLGERLEALVRIYPDLCPHLVPAVWPQLPRELVVRQVHRQDLF